MFKVIDTSNTGKISYEGYFQNKDWFIFIF